ncbi:hypothetical protein DICPUDRAFT_79907 [Dictyostelium purpureum]|uniref:SIS domain-containing protein n=1 Tax=Dictyostelium purpureum TaxID=5786 RepID=F0ZNZ9_DICPU|nr:uncharacterized protein DICPUDRAFT_79907 [Dictyostelium purpureum]EGC34339.1 hypothetical protein DICPUDRAFT_79907 [Dictyostelium purpureum]|eukprot:XP_003289132.1 hypothetical protein DICPUDRAFT_79907 [Dictyostelium purpureum]
MEDLRKKQPIRNPLRNQHPHNMYDMIMDTPVALERVLNEEAENIKSIAKVLSSRKKVYLIGIGTSLHAAQNAHFYLRNIAHVDCEAINSFEFISNPPFYLNKDDCAMIIFSHSGIKTFSYEAYMKNKELGIYTVLITSTESVIDQPMDAIIRTSKIEQSAAFTISHSCSTLCSLLLSVEIAKNRGIAIDNQAKLEEQIKQLPQIFRGINEKSTEDIKKWCDFANTRTLNYFIAYGANESNASEVSLKMQEATYTFYQGYNLEFYLHGPFVATNKDTCTTFVVTERTDKTKRAVERSIKALNAVLFVNGKGAVIIPESDTESISQITKDHADNLFILRSPSNILEPVSVLTNLYILQSMTYWMAVLKGTNPDSFKRQIPPNDTAFIKAGLIL